MSKSNMYSDSVKKEPREDDDKCAECGGFRMGENIIHKDGCSQSPTTTTVDKPAEPPLYKCTKCGTITNSLDFAQDICRRNICPKCGHGTFTLPELREDEPKHYSCRLCGNEITVVEHEVSKLTREVKQETLQWLLNNFYWNRYTSSKELIRKFHKIKEEYKN